MRFSFSSALFRIMQLSLELNNVVHIKPML